MNDTQICVELAKALWCDRETGEYDDSGEGTMPAKSAADFVDFAALMLEEYHTKLAPSACTITPEAAPQLYEATVDLLAIVEAEIQDDPEPEDLGSWHRAINAAHLAIAKATGGTIAIGNTVENIDCSAIKLRGDLPPTLEEFQAIGRDVDDIGEELRDASLMGERGRLYGGYYIGKMCMENIQPENCPHVPQSTWLAIAEGDKWTCLLGRYELVGNLEEVEEKLYKYAISEGLTRKELGITSC